MKRKPKQSPVDQRRAQIQKQLETLRSRKNEKTPRDFKTAERFEEWAEKRDRKLRALDEELTLLDDAGDYYELPLALAALELGVTLEQMVDIISEELIETSFESDYRAGHRITRDELARAIDIGAEELLRLANKTAEDTFADAIECIRFRHLDGLDACYLRLERLNFAEPYWAVLDTMIRFLKREYDDVFRELSIGLEFIDGERDTRAMSAMDALQRAMEATNPADHIAAVMKERILAVAEGKKLAKYDHTYSRFQATEFPSKMDENQRRAMFFATVVKEAAAKYRFDISIRKRNFDSDEYERVVRNAIYTALEAESTYDDSPSSKFFVDRFADLLPRRWIPAELITFLPKNVKNEPATGAKL